MELIFEDEFWFDIKNKDITYERTEFSWDKIPVYKFKYRNDTIAYILIGINRFPDYDSPHVIDEIDGLDSLKFVEVSELTLYPDHLVSSTINNLINWKLIYDAH